MILFPLKSSPYQDLSYHSQRCLHDTLTMTPPLHTWVDSSLLFPPTFQDSLSFFPKNCIFLSLFNASLLSVSCILSILFPRFWIIFTIIILNSFSGRLPISSSFVRSGVFLPCSSSAMCFSVFSFCLSYCVWGLLFAGCRFVVPFVFGICPQ